MKPILFNTEMVQAILDGRKTVTRRAVKPRQLRVLNSPYKKEHPEVPDKVLIEKLCAPPCRPGDILYVRETWAKQSGLYWHKAGLELDEHGRAYHGTVPPEKWRPSIHMPKEAARIFLRVTDVRVERLRDIRCNDMMAEGVIPKTVTGGQWRQWQDDYMKPVWDSTVQSKDRDLYGWAANPWVWVIAFERISKEEAGA